MKIIGYGLCGKNEKRLKQTLDCFKKLCDETYILGNNCTEVERKAIKEAGARYTEDNREWGKYQNVIKEDFVRNHIAPLNPDITICLDMDEVLVAEREDIEALASIGGGWYVYIVNLWNDGWKEEWSFWNIRLWFWDRRGEMGDEFFQFINRPLHCGLAPAWVYKTGNYAPFILKHYGLKDKEDRDRKIERYKKYDPKQIYRDPSYYSILKSNTSKSFNEKEIESKIKEWISTLKQKRKQLTMKKQEEVVYVIRKEDGMRLAIPKKHLEQTLKRGFIEDKRLVTATIPQAVSGLVVETQITKSKVCEICGKKKCSH